MHDTQVFFFIYTLKWTGSMHAAACAVKKHTDAPHFLVGLFYGFVHRVFREISQGIV